MIVIVIVFVHVRCLIRSNWQPFVVALHQVANEICLLVDRSHNDSFLPRLYISHTRVRGGGNTHVLNGCAVQSPSSFKEVLAGVQSRSQWTSQ